MKEDLKQECIRRLNILKLDSKIVNDFEKQNIVYLSKLKENVTEVITNDEVNKLIELLESNKKVKIYHIINSDNKFYILCIHGQSNVWNEERKQLKNGFAEVLVGILKRDELGDYKIYDIGINVENGNIQKVVECTTK